MSKTKDILDYAEEARMDREDFSRIGAALTYATSLNIVAQRNGFADWNELSQKVPGPSNPEEFPTTERLKNIPDNWFGSPTFSRRGWRWDDPENGANSVRLFKGLADDPDPSRRQDHVVIVRNGVVVGRGGGEIPDVSPADYE